MLDGKLEQLLQDYERFIGEKNTKSSFYNGIYDRYINPVLSAAHVPPYWKYDFDSEKNPFVMERLGVNAVFNSGALYRGGKYYLAARVEGNDRKSFFAIAESDSPLDGFRFRDYPVILPDTEKDETNVYDMRLTAHEDGWIYGVFCSESKDNSTAELSADLSAAKAEAGIVRTKDLKNWERLPNLISTSQQRNVILHPEFVRGQYAFYTRPQDGFIETGSGGGIGFALCEDITNPVIGEEIITSRRKYHTVTEAKNGGGAVPIKTEKGWIHIAHGVRNTAAGLRYVIYVFATDLNEPSKVIAEPSGYFIAPTGEERVGDVSNVTFTNGAVVNEKGEVYIYYASSDTRLHVASTTLEKLIDYTFNTPPDALRTVDCVKQRTELIKNNIAIMNTHADEKRKIEQEYQSWLINAHKDEALMCALRSMRDNYAIKQDSFYMNLEFGTGGLRGIMGAGTNRMNLYTVGKVTQGLANYICRKDKKPSVVIAYDTRNNSSLFARLSAEILSANGAEVYLFSSERPTPMLSFAVREKKASCGIVITASHNPKEYNGYKVYGSDGGQLTDDFANAVLSEINALDIFKDIKFTVENNAVAGQINLIDSEIDDIYYKKVENVVMREKLIREKASQLKIIYTPIHGSGNIPVRTMLGRLGFTALEVVAAQEKPDGDFPTVKKPNPEESEVFTLALRMAQSREVDLIFGTDPDSDRIGVLSKNKNGKFEVLTGNQTGALLCEYIIKTRRELGIMPKNPAVISTIVTSSIKNMICAHEDNKIECRDLLTGFKYIAEVIGEWEKSGEFDFIYGYEESFGYLAGDFVRDKDAVIAAVLVCEMALYYKTVENKTLYEALQGIYKKYGHAEDLLINVTMPGKDGKEKMAKLMDKLRGDYKTLFEGQKIAVFEDFKCSKRVFINEGREEKIDLPSSNVLKFTFSDSSWLALRPSGTEPKIKLYMCVVAENREAALQKADALKNTVKKIIPEAEI